MSRAEVALHRSVPEPQRDDAMSETRISTSGFRASLDHAFSEVAGHRVEHAKELSKSRDLTPAGRKAAREIVKNGTSSGTESV